VIRSQVGQVESVGAGPRPASGAPLADGLAAHRRLVDEGWHILADDDPELHALLAADLARQSATLPMVAHASSADPSVLACGSAALSNVTAEGYPGGRFHPGCTWLDRVERLAIERAKAAFGARYANVQPHSCSSANLAVLVSLLQPGDPVLGLHLDAGGHLTHGARASVTGTYFAAHSYGLGDDGRIDLADVLAQATTHRPKVIIVGASSYPRTIDYAAFRHVADKVGAYLLADISHVAGLVAAGVHPNPIDVAHVTTTSTYKQLGGPRGGLILMGRDADAASPDGRCTLRQLFQRGVFPRSQGSLNPGAIAAKARALELVLRPEFRELARLIAADARALAAAFAARGLHILNGGTDTHMVLVDLTATGLSGLVAERALEACGILANRNRIPGDTRPPRVASGLRFGTNMLAQRGFQPDDMDRCADLVVRVLDAVAPVDDEAFRLDPAVRDRVERAVARLVADHPIPGYRPW
jgi:glycine hydroxymethyltransferase